jgi:CheY-like chemotaxis protein
MARILIADDDEAVRTLLSYMLLDDGHTVQTAADGLEAVRACRDQPFDLLLCDIFMPGMDGLEAIRGFRKDYPQLRVVAMSGGSPNNDGALLRVARLMGAAAILEKPFVWADIKRAIEKALEPAESDTLTVRQSYAPRPALS